MGDKSFQTNSDNINISEREQVEQERNLLACIVEHSDDAIISKTLDGVILNWNLGAEKIYGYSAKEVIGKSISILAPLNSPDENSQILHRIKQGDHVDHYETVRLRKDGQKIVVSLTISPIKDTAGNIIAVSTIARNITQRKRMEDALQQQTIELGERVKELNCLYNISKVCEHRELSLDQVLQKIINLIPSAWQFSESTCAQLTVHGKIYRTDNYKETNWKQSCNISLRGKLIGAVEVCCLEVKSDSNAGLFLKEEKKLLGTIAERVAAIIEVRQTYQGLKKAHTELEERVEARTHEIEQRRRVAESLREILAILNSNRSLNEILDYIVAQISWLLNTDAGAIYHLQNNDELLYLQAVRGSEFSDTTNLTIPVGLGPTGVAVLRRRPVIVANTTLYLKNNRQTASELQQHPDIVHLVHHYQAILAVPLIVKAEVYGAISLYYHEPREFSDEVVNLAVAFADQAALAIENAGLRAQTEQNAVVAERNRLARDLHDAVTQTLFSASLIAEVLPRLWDKNRAEGNRRLEELRQLTRGALAEMRTLLLELRPATLADAKLDELLRHLTEAITGRARTPVTLEVQGDCMLPPEVKVALYRITQETLNNIAKHARAKQAVVRLRCVPEQVVLQIEDNGRGFKPANVSLEHLGLDIMRERTEDIGATLKLQSQPGQGTQIEVVWPVPQKKERL